jgi:tetrapyrrole methylase family protein/MazG family protein
LPAHLRVFSFDHLYEEGRTFEEVYSRIVEEVMALGKRPGGVVYAVPGHPFVAEATSPEIYRQAQQEGLPVRVVAGMSFLEPALTALGIDPFPQLALLDALELGRLHVPPFPPSTPALIAQIYSPMVASEVKLVLMASYPDEHPVRLVHAAGTDQEKVEDLPLYEIDRSPHIGLLTALYLPPLATGSSFEEFQEIVARLRLPDGCPWDREQTHLSLRQYLLEETYEVLAALDAGHAGELQEELGDLLLQIVLHAQIAEENGDFRMVDVLQHIYKKLVRRHPHVFGDVAIADAQGVLQNWERLKAAERATNGKAEASLLDGVAPTLPALLQAEQYQHRAARVGFDWPDIQGVIDKLNEELLEVHNAEDAAARAFEIGDLLFAVVNLARWHQLDPESALREANRRFRRRFGYIETSARLVGRELHDLTLAEMEVLWQEAKQVKR